MLEKRFRLWNFEEDVKGVFRDLHKLVLKLPLSDLVNSGRQFPMNRVAAHYQSDNTGNNHVFQVSEQLFLLKN